MTFEEGVRKHEASDSFITLDIASLSLLVAASASTMVVDAGQEDGNAGAPAPFKKTITKKGLQQGGEVTLMESSATTGRERTSVLIDVAYDEQDLCDVFPVKNPPAAVRASSHCRRISSRRSSPWLRPRRVLALFASLSSMGTLILIYLTLSMWKMTAGHANAQG